MAQSVRSSAKLIASAVNPDHNRNINAFVQCQSPNIEDANDIIDIPGSDRNLLPLNGSEFGEDGDSMRSNAK